MDKGKYFESTGGNPCELSHRFYTIDFHKLALSTKMGLTHIDVEIETNRLMEISPISPPIHVEKVSVTFRDLDRLSTGKWTKIEAG